MQPTAQQQAVFDAVAGTAAHIACEAVAGAGKTTVAVGSAQRCSGKVGFCAKNKHIAAEMQTRLGTSASAATLASLGFAACRKAVSGIDLEEGKSKRLLRDCKPNWFWKASSGAWIPNDDAKSALQLAKLCKYTLADETCIDDLDALVDHHNIELNGSTDSIYAAAADLVDRSARETNTLDFDDMVWLPIRRDWSVGGFDTLFIDEAQDLSRGEQTLARKAGQRLVVVGDSQQAIYGFSGADCDALPNLVAAMGQAPEGLEKRPLTVTFRCPRSHVTLARKIVPHLEAAEHAVDGYVYQADPEDLHRELQPGDMAICRRNAPLVSTVYRLLTAGVPAIIKGRDVGSNLLDLVKLLKASTPEELGRKLTGYETKERGRLQRRNASEDQLQALEDRVTCLDTLASQCESIGELETLIGSLFSDDAAARTGKVVLSSVHRAKGLEANRVVLLEPAKLGTSHKNAQDWERVQNRNLAYIALTRAKSELVFAGDVPAICNGAGAVVGKRPLF